jgi:hypothetical protein
LLERVSSFSRLFELIGALLRDALTRCHAQKTLRGIHLYPRWPGLPDETRKTIYRYEKRPDTMGSGFFPELFTHVGQWGTHVDPPAHFVKGLRTVDHIVDSEGFRELT